MKENITEIFNKSLQKLCAPRAHRLTLLQMNTARLGRKAYVFLVPPFIQQMALRIRSEESAAGQA